MKSKKSIFLLIIFLLLTGCKEKTYTVTFDTQGGNKIENINIPKGENLKKVTSPNKEGFLFVNWQKDGVEYDLETPITEDITLTASWIETPEMHDYYTVIFVIGDKQEKTTVKELETVNEPEVEKKENYQFIGWFVGEEKFDFNTKITKDITITAKYKLDTVTISYELDGGEGLSQETILKNSLISIPENPTKEGYKFLKWTLNEKEFSFDTKITEDITLKAIWEKVEYVTISFDTDGGNIIEPIQIEKYSKIDKLPIPIKKEYTFKEWNINNIKFDSDTPIENNIILKAIYNKEGEE